jgi:cyclopropane fatty-acyl-phospholipid synthase-like methyltransferase
MYEMRTWENRKGPVLLKRIGVKPGHTVVDLGCRVGHYSIPAAIPVGLDARVYATDNDRDALNRLSVKASASRKIFLRVCTQGRSRLRVNR